jgi:hypothetical protein
VYRSVRLQMDSLEVATQAFRTLGVRPEEMLRTLREPAGSSVGSHGVCLVHERFKRLQRPSQFSPEAPSEMMRCTHRLLEVPIIGTLTTS